MSTDKIRLESLPAMRISELLEPSMLRARYESRTSEHWVGAPGCGKTAVASVDTPRLLSQMYGEEFGVVVQTATTMDAPDWRGFLIPHKDEATGERVSSFTRSPAMPSREYLKKFPRGVYVLDERSQADMLSQKAMAPAVLAKQFGDEYLPDGWWMISCSNRMQDRSGVIKPPMHLINRERTILFEMHIQDSVDWWTNVMEMHPMGIQWAKDHADQLFVQEIPSDPVPYATARSYTRAWDLIGQVVEKDDYGRYSMEIPKTDMLNKLVAGHIGRARAAEMFAYFDVFKELPTLNEIETRPLSAKLPPKNRLDIAFLCMSMCVQQVRIDTLDAVWQYIERLPRELQVVAAQRVQQKTKGVALNSPRINAWMGKNQVLILAAAG